MSLGRVQAEAVTQAVVARPGELAACTVRVRNDGPSDTVLMVRVHGLGHSSSYVPISGAPLPPGHEVEVEVPLEVPESFGIGAHALAVEIGSGKPEDRSALVKVVLTIGAPEGITTRINPSVVRGGRRARFGVEVHNRTGARAQVEMRGSGPGLRVTLQHRQLTLRAGETVEVRGKVRGPRRWVGDPVQHVLTVESSADSVPTYSTASYRQRALMPRRLRGGLVGVAFLVIWALLAAAVVLVWARKDDAEVATDTTGQSTDGSSLTPLTNPDGSPASGTDGAGGAGGSGSAGGSSGGDDAGAAGAGAPTQTIVRGTVKAGATGSDDGVLVTLTPTNPGETQQVATAGGAIVGDGSTPSGEASTVLQGRGPGSGMRVVSARTPAKSDEPATKFWPARYGTYGSSSLADVRTLSVVSVASGEGGAFEFQQVALRASYEVSFAKPGFTTRSYIVTPTDDGKPVELEVELAPGDGGMSGAVTGPSGAADVSVTDGTLTFTTTTSTDAATQGRWSIAGLSTPGTYTVTVTSHGFGTEVMQVRLDPGQVRTGLNLALTPDVGSISGTVTSGGTAQGGVTLVATAGDAAITTTSLTEGATGTYNFPQMALGSTYTITASADGYITQTRSVTVDGNDTGIDFALVRSTATIIGRVDSSREGVVSPLVSAAVTVSAGDLQVRTSSAAAPDAGAFTVSDLPPGTYVLAASRYDHPEVSQLVTLSAGQVFDAGQILLTYQARAQLTPTGSLVVRTVDSFGVELPGATVQLIDVGGSIAPQSKTMAATESSVSFTAVPIGTYQVRVTKNNYRPTTLSAVSIGLGPIERQVTMLQYGTARGTVIDAVAGFTTTGRVWVTADDPEQPVVFDPTSPILLPPASQVGPGAVAAFQDADGHLIVQYDDGRLFRDGTGDGVPEQLLTSIRIGSRPLSNYELLLYRMDSGSPVCIGVIAATSDEWEIDPSMQLLSGSYVLRFGSAPGDVGSQCAGRGRTPAGFAPITSDAAGNVAAFDVAESLDQKVLVDPIPVAPFPQIAGRVLVPRVVGGTVQFDNFAQASAAGLSVVLDCGVFGTADATISAGAAPSDPVTFALTREQLQALFPGVAYDPATGNLPACTLRTSYTSTNEFIPVEHSLSLQVGLAAGGYPDRALSVALVADPGIITGTVQWRDLGASQPGEPLTYAIGDASVASDLPVIVGYSATDAGDPDPLNPVVAGDPGTQTALVSATSDVAGAFAFAITGQRQVLDTAGYKVNANLFDELAMSITATAGDWTATASPTPPADFVDNGSSVDVFLNPNPGTLVVPATIVSVRGNRAAAELQVEATPPGGTSATWPFVGVNGDDSPDAEYRTPGPAGTWQVDYSTSSPSNLEITSTPTNDRPFVRPADVGTAATLSAVELGQIDVNLSTDASIASPINTGTVTLRQQAVGATVPVGPWVDRSSSPTAGAVQFARLPVDAASPTSATSAVTYVLDADVPLHDVPTSTVRVTHLNPDGSDGSFVDYSGTITGIAISVRAGERVRVDMIVPAYASISGSLRGRITPAGVPLQTTPLTLSATTTVIATRVSDGSQHPAVTIDPVAGTWAVQVPADAYTISVVAQNHVSPPDINVPTLGASGSADPSTVAGLAVLVDLNAGTYNLTALDSASLGGLPVEGASIELYWGDYNPLGPPATPVHPLAADGPALTDVDGGFQFTGVYPGMYTVVIRKIVGGVDANFPVIGTVDIPVWPTSTGSTTTHTVAMPSVGGSITGDVNAVSASTDRPVALPDDVTVSRTYDLAQLQGTGILANDATEADLAIPPAVSLPIEEAAAGVGDTYKFENLPYGTHRLTFSDAAGYDVSNNPRDVPVDGEEIDVDATYRAADVDVVVTLTDSEDGTPIEGAELTLTTTVVGQEAPPSASDDGDGVYTFADVAPDLDDYLLHVEADGYGERTDTLLTVAPSADAQPEAVELTPVAKVSGFAKRQGAGGTLTPATGPVTLRKVGSPARPDVTVEPGPNGEFLFEIGPDDLGVYQVIVAEPGHQTATASVNGGVAVQLRQPYALGNVTARAYATATITVTGPTSGTTLNLSPAATVAGPTAGVYTITQLDPDTSYTASVTHPDYFDEPVFANVTPAVGATLSYTVTMDPRPATATIRVTGGASIDGLDLEVTPSGPTVSGPNAMGTFSVTGLVSGTTYAFVITSDDYQDHTVAGGYTATPNGTFNPAAITLVGKPASATITVTGGGSVAGLALAVSPTGPTVSGPTAGVFTVTGLTSGTAYTFTVTSTDYATYTIPGGYTATPNGTFTPAAITLTPKPASATITVTGGGSITGLALTVTPSGATVSGPTAGVFTVTNLSPGTTYAFKVTSNNYEDHTIAGGYTATANGTFTPSAITLTPKPASATITVTGGGSIAGLALNVTPSGATVSGPTAGVFSVTNLAFGTTYAFTVTSTNYQDHVIAGGYTATANGTFTPAAITLIGKPATATITVTGPAATETSLAVVSSPSVTPSRSGAVFTFTLVAGTAYTFTASATGYTSATTNYTAAANGSFADNLAPVAS